MSEFSFLLYPYHLGVSTTWINRGHKVFPCCLEARDGKRESRTVSDLVLCPNCRFITSQLCPWAYYAIISSSGHSCFVVFLTWPYFSLVAGRDRFIVLPYNFQFCIIESSQGSHSPIYISLRINVSQRFSYLHPTIRFVLDERSPDILRSTKPIA
jgi:hypothetical protein